MAIDHDQLLQRIRLMWPNAEEKEYLVNLIQLDAASKGSEKVAAPASPVIPPAAPIENPES